MIYSFNTKEIYKYLDVRVKHGYENDRYRMKVNQDFNKLFGYILKKINLEINDENKNQLKKIFNYCTSRFTTSGGFIY